MSKLTWPETRDTIAVLSTIGFLGAYAVAWFVKLPPDPATAQYIGQMQGAIITQWALIMGWYFGSSKSTGQLRDQVGKMIDKVPDAGS